jgi:hypothetical protein
MIRAQKLKFVNGNVVSDDIQIGHNLSDRNMSVRVFYAVDILFKFSLPSKYLLYVWQYVICVNTLYTLTRGRKSSFINNENYINSNSKSEINKISKKKKKRR